MAVQTGLLSEKDLKRLKVAIASSGEALAPFCEDTLEVLKMILGHHYGGKKRAQAPDPVNLLEMAVAIYLPFLAANCPQFMVQAEPSWLKPMAATTELAVNKRAKDMNLEKAVQRVVLDALVCVGVLKIGKEGRWSDTLDEMTGEVYAEAVHISDLVLDMSANSWEEVSFIGHRYRMPLEEAQNNPAFDETARRKLRAVTQKSTDDHGTKQPQTLSKGDALDIDEFEERTELIELFLPRRGGRGVLVTIPAEGEPELLQAEKWEGPEGGPYYPLSFFEAPKNIMPSAPANHWRELHRLANELFRKISRQAVDQKTVTGYTAGAADDAARLKNARDGQMIKMDNVEGIKEFKSGGADPLTAVQFQNAMALFKQISGNLDSLGGLGPSAGTLGAEQLLGANASRKLQWMQGQVYSWMERAGRSLCWWIWEDSLYDPKLYKRVEMPGGSPLAIPTSFAKPRRLGDFSDYNFSVQPYSMQYRSPAQELEVLAGIFAQYIVPFAQMLEASGKTINWNGMLKLVARLSHFKELETILIDKTGAMSEPEQAGAGRERRAVNPNKPNGEYTRRNVSVASEEDKAVQAIGAAASARGRGAMAS
jgi:hypothetical protein